MKLSQTLEAYKRLFATQYKPIDAMTEEQAIDITIMKDIPQSMERIPKANQPISYL